VPAPATLELLSGMSHFTDGTMTELATPTGVAILKYFCGEYGATPPKDARRVGYGAGTKEFAHPNVFKVML
jgi:uncharacterized protein (DUF111 family)